MKAATALTELELLEEELRSVRRRAARARRSLEAAFDREEELEARRYHLELEHLALTGTIHTTIEGYCPACGGDRSELERCRP